MKKHLKRISLAALTAIACVSCIEIAVGTAVVAGAGYIANSGVVSTHLDLSAEKAHNAAHLYLRQREAQITHLSITNTSVHAKISKTERVKFNFTKITENTCKIELRCLRKGLPSNELADAIYNEFIASLN